MTAGSMCILPWLRLSAEVEFGGVRVAPLSRVRERNATLLATAQQMSGFYTDMYGKPFDVAVLWARRGRPFSAVGPQRRWERSAHIEMWTLACIAENEYFFWSQPITASHLSWFFQGFRVGSNFITLWIRRREGETLSSQDATKIRLTVPLAASTDAKPKWEPSFLAALCGCVGGTAPLDSRVRSSVTNFLDANRLGEFGTPYGDLVWLGAALEQLLDVKFPEIGRKLAEALDDLFAAYRTTKTTWSDRKGNARQVSWVYRWAREFYDARSAIHGGPAKATTWLEWEHGLIATVVYALAVKMLLARDGRYVLTQHDESEAEAMNDRLAGGTPVMRCWRQAGDDSGWRIIARNAAATIRAAQAAEASRVGAN